MVARPGWGSLAATGVSFVEGGGIVGLLRVGANLLGPVKVKVNCAPIC